MPTNDPTPYVPTAGGWLRLLAGLNAAGFSLILWAFQRWISHHEETLKRIDSRLERLTEQVERRTSSLESRVAVSEERLRILEEAWRNNRPAQR